MFHFDLLFHLQHYKQLIVPKIAQLLSVADPRGRGPLPTPVKTSQKKDGRHAAPRSKFLESSEPPSDKFLDPLLALRCKCNFEQ